MRVRAREEKRGSDGEMRTRRAESTGPPQKCLHDHESVDLGATRVAQPVMYDFKVFLIQAKKFPTGELKASRST